MKRIFFVSLNSKKLDDFLANNEFDNLLNGFDNLDLFVFDTYEKLNGIFFNDSAIETQDGVIEKKIDLIVEAGLKSNNQTQLIRCSKFEKHFENHIAVVYSEFYKNRKFHNHCKSQIFQNLHPKLKSKNIITNKSPLIDILVPFLLVEIAIYLYLYDTGSYQEIYGLESEMGILLDIKANKYPAFESFLNHLLPHSKINAQAN